MSIDWPQFTPLSALLGGILIGIAVSMFALINGRIAGISSILGGLFRMKAGSIGWRMAFLAGLIAAPLLYAAVATLPPITIATGWPVLILSGLLVGLGTRFGSGCTSGHGVCGLASLSVRSVVATLLFMGAGMATVYVMRHLVGG